LNSTARGEVVSDGTTTEPRRVVPACDWAYADRMSSHAVDIFCEMAQACRRGVRMKPRSLNDKEYFAQDWFIERLNAVGVEYEQQGRNSYPDFWVGGSQDVEGYEIKSLAVVKGKPARTTIDFNSTIPSGRKEGRDVFLVFFLYEGTGAERAVHSVSVAHGDLINSDHALADEHLNVAVHDFGAFADGFIRNRKMYVFPHPITIDPTGLARLRLIVPTSWKMADRRLKRVRRIERKVAAQTVDRYTIRLRGKGEAEVTKTRAADAGRALEFDVFETA